MPPCEKVAWSCRKIERCASAPGRGGMIWNPAGLWVSEAWHPLHVPIASAWRYGSGVAVCHTVPSWKRENFARYMGPGPLSSWP